MAIFLKLLCKFYDSNKHPIEVSDESHEDYKDPCKLLVKGATARIILRCNGLWFCGALGARSTAPRWTHAQTTSSCWNTLAPAGEA